MAYSDITLTVCSDGLDPRATSLFPDGDRPSLSGGSAALGWVTNGDLSDGDYIEIRTDGTNAFGAGEPLFQSFSVVGDSIHENGVANAYMAGIANNEYIRARSSSNSGMSNDPTSPWDGALNVTKTTTTRHANINSALKFNAFPNQHPSGTELGVLVWPLAYIGTAGNRVLQAGTKFFSSWMWYDYDNGAEMIAIKYGSITGTFSLGSNTIPVKSGNNLTGGVVNIGERMTIVNPVGKTAQGYVNAIDTVNKIIYFYQDISVTEWTNAEYYSSVITGQTSGAVCTFETVPAWTSGATFASGDKVYDPAFAKCYISQQNGNINHDPVGDGGTWWVVDNTYMFGEGSSKSGRVMQDALVSGNNTATLIVGVEGSITGEVFNGTTGMGKFKSYNTNPQPRTWHRRTVWVDYTADVNGKVSMYQLIDGVLDTVKIDQYSIRHDIRPILSNWGIEANVDNGHTAICSELKTYTDIFGCILSNSATYAGIDYATAEPLMMTKTRTNTRAGFKLSRGVYASCSGKYLYVMRDPATPINTSGLLLTGA